MLVCSVFDKASSWLWKILKLEMSTFVMRMDNVLSLISQPFIVCGLGCAHNRPRVISYIIGMHAGAAHIDTYIARYNMYINNWALSKPGRRYSGSIKYEKIPEQATTHHTRSCSGNCIGPQIGATAAQERVDMMVLGGHAGYVPETSPVCLFLCTPPN